MTDDEIRASGGPAFPVSIPGVGDNGWHGMTLRDWFAGQALSGLLQNLHVQGSFEHSIERNTEAAYSLADAMLDTRTLKQKVASSPESK